MKKTCLLYLATFAALEAVLTVLLALLWPPQPELTPPLPPIELRLASAAIGAGLAALFLTLAIAGIDSVVMRLAERTRLGRALAGERPEDGRFVAAGTLVADGPLLEAPLSGTPCITYHYELRRVGHGSSGSTTSCWGYALTPSHVETPAGAVRLLAYTDLDFKPSTPKGPEMLERAQRHFARAKWVTIGLGSLGNAWDQLQQVLADDDGTIRTDFGPAPSALEESGYFFSEKVVRDREPICAFGTYSDLRHGLVPVPGAREIWPIRIVKGTGKQVQGRLLLSALGQVVVTLVLAGIGVGVAVGFLKLAPGLW